MVAEAYRIWGIAAWQKVIRGGRGSALRPTPQCHSGEMEVLVASPSLSRGAEHPARSDRGCGRQDPPGARPSSRGDSRWPRRGSGSRRGARAGPGLITWRSRRRPPGIAFFLFREPPLPCRAAAAHRPGSDPSPPPHPRNSLVARGHHLLALAVAERVRLPRAVLGARGCGWRRPWLRLLLLLLWRRTRLAQLLKDLRGRTG